MMMKLRLDNQVLVPHLKLANTLWLRTRGLIGRPELKPDEGLWILKCNSVHTFFMSVPLDLVFLDRKLKVVKTYQNVKPNRLILPIWRASSVVELREGFLKTSPLTQGEQLHVDPTLS